MRADFTLWKNNDALNCTQKNNDALNCTQKNNDALNYTQKNNDALNYTQKNNESIFLAPIFLLTFYMNNEYALMHINQKIPSSDDFANILKLLYTLKTTTILESWIFLTVWPASSSQQSVLPLISLVVFLLYVSGDVVTSQFSC